MLGEQMDALIDDDMGKICRPEQNRSMRRVMKKCANPLCTHIIYSDGYKYGEGSYCDKYCKHEGTMYNAGQKAIIRRQKQFA